MENNFQVDFCYRSPPFLFSKTNINPISENRNVKFIEIFGKILWLDINIITLHRLIKF